MNSISEDFFPSAEELLPGIQKSGKTNKYSPLAYRMRPRTLEEVAGQKHLLAKDKLLRRAICSDTLTSAIFYGPPGCGKTTLAEVVANFTKRDFCRLSAVGASVKDVREVIAFSKRKHQAGKHGAVLFLDEIHRFSKSQQDVLLPSVEDGTIVLIGATTENPFFVLNSALISRSRVFQFEPLKKEDVIFVLNRALTNKEYGLGELEVEVDNEALDFLATGCDGDVRIALSALELAVKSVVAENRNKIDLAEIEASLQRKNIVYDRGGDAHYDTISAFIKSMRGSDPDAAIYWLAKMIEAGEDPRFIARRLIIFASEDVGCADPLALSQALAAFQAVERVGLPEAQINLGHITIYLACAPKSNAAHAALLKAQKEIREGRTMEVPLHLRDSHYKSAKKLGHGEGYKYSHDSKDHFVVQDYLPEPRRFYEPSQQGWEAKIAERVANWRKQKEATKKATCK